MKSVACRPDQLQDILCRLGDIGAGAKDRLDACIHQELVVLLWDHAATHNKYIASARILKRADQLGREGLMTRCLRADADDMDVVVDGILCGLSRVWNKGPTSTSKPMSAKAVAMTLAPRS